MSVLIADDHAIVRDGVRMILIGSRQHFEVGEADSRDTLLQRVSEQAWDLLILDLTFPGASGLDLLREVKEIQPDLPVLVLSMHGDGQYAVRAMRGGASGYLTKESAAHELIEAVTRIGRGGRYVSTAVMEALVTEIAAETTKPHRKLNSRELEVLSLTARTLSAGEIARQLDISIKTVSTYRARILEKLGLKNTAQLIHYAIEHRLVQ